LGSVAIPVSRGIFTVALGDIQISNMVPISPTVFTNGGVHLRVWFTATSNDFQQLRPDQRVSAVAYAMMANDVADGSITGAKLAEGSISAGKLASDVKAGLSGVVFSDDPSSTNLLAAGYSQHGDTQVSTERWQATFAANPAPGRSQPSAVWTGSELIMWGGY